MTMTHSLPEWSLGDRLRKARESAEISRTDMREKLLAVGISASISTLSAWETDTARPGRGKDFLKVIAAWSRISGVPETWILDLQDPSRPGGDSAAERGTTSRYARSAADRREDLVA